MRLQGLPFTSQKPSLEFFSPALQGQALQAWGDGRIDEFLSLSNGNHCWLDVVLNNTRALRERGLYEAALYRAFIGTRGNNRHFSLGLLRLLFKIANRTRLRAAADPLPGPGPFNLFRGVGGTGKARRIKGISWTDSLDCAIWFAGRFQWLKDPAVYSVTVQERDVLAYSNQREEGEYVVLLPTEAKPVRVSGFDVAREFTRVESGRRQKDLARLEQLKVKA